jgi:hypothetical protein
MTEDNNDRSKSGIGPGLAVFGCLATGVIGCLAGLDGLGGGELVGAGVCLMAAALAFGIVVYVSFSR